MKKIFAILMAAMLVMALSVSAFAAETVVFDEPEGRAFSDLVNPWDFFGTDAYWGREAATGVLSVNLEEIKPFFEEGGYTFTYVYSGSEAGNPSLNFEFWSENSVDGTPFVVTDLGNGTYEASVSLDDHLAAWTAAGYTLDDAEAFLIQVWTGDFKLISAKFTNEAPAPAPDDNNGDDNNGDDNNGDDNTPANTGIALAVVPAVVAMVAVAVSKKH